MSKAVAVVLIAVLTVASSAASAPEGTSGQVAPSVYEGWRFGVAPYAWFAGLRGELSTIAGLPPVSVDRSASKVLEDLDSVFMFLGEVQKGRWGGLVGYIYSSRETGGAIVGSDFTTLATSSKSSTIDAAGFYRGWTRRNAFVDVVGGARIWTTKLDLELDAGLPTEVLVSEDQTWVDPLIGAKARYTGGDTGWFLSGFAFIGGFGLASDFMWDIDANVGFQWVPAFSTLLGYRYLDVKYQNGDYLYDVAQDGTVLAVLFSF